MTGEAGIRGHLALSRVGTVCPLEQGIVIIQHRLTMDRIVLTLVRDLLNAFWWNVQVWFQALIIYVYTYFIFSSCNIYFIVIF